MKRISVWVGASFVVIGMLIQCNPLNTVSDPTNLVIDNLNKEQEKKTEWIIGLDSVTMNHIILRDTFPVSKYTNYPGDTLIFKIHGMKLKQKVFDENYNVTYINHDVSEADSIRYIWTSSPSLSSSGDTEDHSVNVYLDSTSFSWKVFYPNTSEGAYPEYGYYLHDKALGCEWYWSLTIRYYIEDTIIDSYLLSFTIDIPDRG